MEEGNTFQNNEIKKIPGNKKSLKYIIGLIVLLAIPLIIYLNLIRIKSRELYNLPVPMITLEPQPTITVTPKPTIVPVVYKEKKNLTIKILNGTGIPGEAAKVARSLENINLKNIETGNWDKTNNIKTMVKLSASVSGTVKEEIINELMKLFDGVEATVSSIITTDVEIITGK